MKKSITTRLLSLILMLSIVLSVLTVFPVITSAEEEEEDSLKVVYNRNYEEGWNYSNGMNDDYKGELGVNLTYNKISASLYNYYLKFSPLDDAGGYVYIPLGDDTPKTGKVFFELDFKASPDNNIGGIIMFEGIGDGRALSHIVSMTDGSLYLLGQRVDDVPTSWKTIKFEFDFDYAANNEDASDKEFLVTVTYDGTVTKERVYTTTSGFGISNIYFGAQENLLGYDREGDFYYVDNVKIYHGTDDFADELPKNNCGSSVNMSKVPDVSIEGAGGGGAYLSGQPAFERLPIGEESVLIHYNRNWSEGWTYGNGTSSNAERENDFNIVTDYASEINKGDSGFYNYYLQMIQRNTQNGFIRIIATSAVPRDGKTFLEFDVKASVGATTGCLIEMITPGANPSSFGLARISGGNLYILGQLVGPIGEEWCHVAAKIDFDYVPANGDTTAFEFTVYVGDNPEPIKQVAYISANPGNHKGIMNLRIGRSGSGNVGDWWGLDNIQLYSADDFAVLPDDNYGSLVNTSWTKDFAVDAGVATPSIPEIVDSALVMKTGSNRALLFGERVNLFTDENGDAYGAPIKNEEGKVMLPLETVLQYTGTPYEYHSQNLACDIFLNGQYTSIAVGRSTAEIKGKTHQLSVTPIVKSFGEERLIYIGLDDIEALFSGFYVTYDDTGLFFIAEYDEFVNRDGNEEYMHETAKKFLFVADEMTEDEYYNLAKENTNNFTHPYILADQDYFDMLHATYGAAAVDPEFDAELISYMDTQVAYANTYVKKYAILDDYGNYVGIKNGRWAYNSQGMATWVTEDKAVPNGYTVEAAGNHSVSIMPYPESGGYDPAGGRLNVLSDGESCLVAALEPAALAYQITRDENYLKFAYDWMVALCSWEHWGPGHYLNCANTTRPLATAFDWFYNDFVRVYGQEKVDWIESRIFENGVYEAWVTLPGREGSGKNHMAPEHVRPNGGDSSLYWNHIGNWNPCCTLGMLIGALVTMKNEEYVATSKFVIDMSLFYYAKNGMTYVTFDGGYRESAGYWACVRFMHFIHQICIDTFGTDLGFTSLPGIDITDYFGCHIENSEYERWVFHDDWAGTQPSYWYYLSAKLYDNPEYAAIRNLHIASGDKDKAPHRYDVLFYDKELLQYTDVDLGLDWIMTSVDTVVSRSSWEPGALYCGIMGGGNNVAHGQYDSGNWIYDNAGINWFVDLGADDYNLYGGGLGGGYYKYTAEGNNTLAISSKQDSLPQGQLKTGWGEIIQSVQNEYGTATVIDNSSVYGGISNVNYARRGMLLTNNRQTVVIQDEVNLVKVQDMYWHAHYDIREVQEVTISDDGRTVYMTSKRIANEHGEMEQKVLRVTLVSGNRGFKFSIRDCYDFTLESTPDPDYSGSINGIYEGSRQNYMRLIIECKGVLKFDLAVVMEVIDPDDPIAEGYTLGWDGQRTALQPMETWVPLADSRVGSGGGAFGDSLEARPSPKISQLFSNLNSITEVIEKGQYLTVDKEQFFKLLAANENILQKNGREGQLDEITEAIRENDAAKAIYDNYQSHISSATDVSVNIAENLIGF